MSCGEIRALFFVTREALVVANEAGEEGQQQREYESHAKSLRQDLQDVYKMNHVDLVSILSNPVSV